MVNDGEVVVVKATTKPPCTEPPCLKDSKEARANSESTYDSEDFTDWSEDDDDEDGESVLSQNVEDDFIDLAFNGKRHCGDGEEQPLSAADRAGDVDEDKKNPAYVPRKGAFFEHDLRKADDEALNIDLEVKSSSESTCSREKWVHDRFDEKSQRPKSVHELVTLYGFNIRKQDKYLNSIVRPVFKHRYRAPGHAERVGGRKRAAMIAKRNAFRTFIVVRNNPEQTDCRGKEKNSKECNNGSSNETKEDKKKKEEPEVREMEKANEKKSPSPSNEKTKPGILKNTKKSNEDNDKVSSNEKFSPKGYLAKSCANKISFDRCQETESSSKKTTSERKWGTFSKNESCIDSFYQRSKALDDCNKAFEESLKYNHLQYDFPSFSGEIFIGRPIYSIRGNFKKKKNMVGSGRIAPVIGSKCSSSSRSSEETSYDPCSTSGNMVYTNSGMSEHFNKKYRPDYTNKVVIEVNNNNNNSTADLNHDNYSHNDDVLREDAYNNYKYKRPWGGDPGYRGYQQPHNYTGWGRFRGGRTPGNRAWCRGDSKFPHETQDVRLIVMCGGNDEENNRDSTSKGENEPISRVNRNILFNKNEKSSDGGLKESRNLNRSFTKEDILPPVTCTVLSRSNKSTPVYSVANETNVTEARNKPPCQLASSNVQGSSQDAKEDASEGHSLNEATNAFKKLSLAKNNIIKPNHLNIGKNNGCMYPRLAVLPKNRLFHPNNFSASQAFVSTAFIFPSGPILPSKTSHDKNSLYGRQLIALPVRVTPMPYLFAPQQQLQQQQQQRMQLPHRMQQTKFKNQSSQQNHYQNYNPHYLTKNNFMSNFPSNFCQTNDTKMRLPSPKTVLRPPFNNNVPASKPTSLPLFSTITVTPPPSALLSCTSSFTTTTITTPSASSSAVSTISSSTPSTSTTSSTQQLNANAFKLSPHAAAFKSTQPLSNQASSAFKARSQGPFTYKSSKKGNYTLTSSDSSYKLTPFKFQPKCPIEVRGGTVYFSLEIQPKRCSSAGKKSSSNMIFATEVLVDKQAQSKTKKALPIIDPKSLKELEEARKADGCEADAAVVGARGSDGDNSVPCAAVSDGDHVDGSSDNGGEVGEIVTDSRGVKSEVIVDEINEKKVENAGENGAGDESGTVVLESAVVGDDVSRGDNSLIVSSGDEGKNSDACKFSDGIGGDVIDDEAKDDGVVQVVSADIKTE